MTLERQLISMICFLTAVVCFLSGTFLTIRRFLIIPSQHPALAYSENAVLDNSTQTVSVPLSISLPSQKTLSIFPTRLHNNDWQVTAQGVSLLVPSEGLQPDQGLIMYGHNWPSILAELHDSNFGDQLTVAYGNHSETYTISSSFTVTPERLDILQLAKPNTLLIYTCTGFLDRERLVVLADKLEH